MNASSKQPPKNPGIVRFVAELRDAGRGGAYVEFPFDVEELFGTKARSPVRLSFGGAPYRGSLVPSFTHKREYAQAILDAKRAETRAKRVAEVMEAARENAAY